MEGRPVPVVVVPGRERSHEVVLSAFAVILGVTYLAGGPRPGSLAALVTGIWGVAFAAGLVLGGGMTLVGSYWLSNLERGLDLERAGLVALSGALLVYVAAVFTAVGWGGLMAAGMAGAWVWANVRRTWQIRRDLLRIEQERG